MPAPSILSAYNRNGWNTWDPQMVLWHFWVEAFVLIVVMLRLGHHLQIALPPMSKGADALIVYG